jgi:hypothetical protein|tara:strand:+ start:291 stop:596 length:306 start_codon:yes stop_codon:yes gene_type:complete
MLLVQWPISNLASLAAVPYSSPAILAMFALLKFQAFYRISIAIRTDIIWPDLHGIRISTLPDKSHRSVWAKHPLIEERFGAEQKPNMQQNSLAASIHEMIA